MRSFIPTYISLLAAAACPQAAFASSSHPSVSTADYHENLVLRPLPLSALLASFNFRSNTTVEDFEADNFHFFPRSLGQILQHAGTRELHLRFSLGRWDAENWGARPWAGKREGGTGVELWAWLDAESDEEADGKWLTLTNALSGLFCASLNFIDSTRTTRPVLSFHPEGNHPADASMQLLYGTLPREVVCTENLTPFLKLLPCKGKAGIASLLDGHKLFDASWQSMAIDVRPLCAADGSGCVLQIEQTIDMVLDVERSKRPRDNPIPRPVPGHELKCDTTKPYHRDDYACFPAPASSTHQDWTLSQIFGRAMRGTCPLADPATPPVCLEVPRDRSVFVSEGVREEASADGREARCFFVEPADALVEIMLPETDAADVAAVVTPQTPLLYAERSLTGHGADRGGVQTMLTNPSPDTEVAFVYMESLPWFMRIYLHTLEARIVGDAGTGGVRQPDIASSGANARNGSASDKVIQQIYYRPALDRARGTQLEVLLRIPPGATVFLTYDFEKSILRYTEYPPDANRGFDVAAAVITIGGGNSGTSNLRTTTLLLSLPTPDFSMPYNVIIFTSTAIALAFGGMFNIIVRRFVAADEAPDASVKAAVAKLASHVRTVLQAKQAVAAVTVLSGTDSSNSGQTDTDASAGSIKEE